MRIRPIAVFLCLNSMPGLALTAHAQYDVTVLQDPGGVGLSQPGSINRSGQSVGWSATSAFTQDAVLWSLSGGAVVVVGDRDGASECGRLQL